jgi:hypothetical protein
VYPTNGGLQQRPQRRLDKGPVLLANCLKARKMVLLS